MAAPEEVESKLDALELIKVRLLSEGVRITQSASDALLSGGKPISLREYVTTSGVIMKLPRDIFVTAPAFEAFCAHSSLLLDHDEAGFFVSGMGQERIEAKPVPIPSYYDTRNKRGVKYIDIGVTHTDRVRISPVQGCSYTCVFCDVPYTLKYALKDVNDIIEAIEVARNDADLPAKHVLISGGTPFPKDEGYLDDVFEKVPKATALPVDVMMVPRKDPKHVEKLYSWGVNSVYYNIEAYGDAAVKSFAARKAQVGHELYMKTISKAVDVFGKGKVQSLIIVGLESIDDTLRGVEELSELGCIPILSPFRPADATPLRMKKPPSTDELITVYERGREVARRHGLKLGPRCIPCHHNTLSFPDGSDFYFYS
jgi:radical SAM superfamily enzyme YgiQ (UPF0313 family)